MTDVKTFLKNILGWAILFGIITISLFVFFPDLAKKIYTGILGLFGIITVAQIPKKTPVPNTQVQKAVEEKKLEEKLKEIDQRTPEESKATLTPETQDKIEAIKKKATDEAVTNIMNRLKDESSL